MANNYDAIVIGSGACGGWAAMELAQAGMKVLMLEAGSHIDPAKDFHHTFLYQMEYRGQPKPGALRRSSGRQEPGLARDASPAGAVDAYAPQPAPLPLLRQLRERLRCGRDVQHGRGDSAAGAEDRQSGGPYGRCGGPGADEPREPRPRR